jgi:hypothetical protein
MKKSTIVSSPIPHQIPHTDELDILPFSRLDWAFAGTSSSELIKQPNGEQVVHSRWTHWVDSRSLTPEEEINDEGDMIPQGKGLTLERGSMVRPTTGQMTEYEECWKDVAPIPIADQERSVNVCAVLLFHDDERKARGMVVRVGQYCQGFLRVGEKMALERWAWSEDGKWQRVTRMGDLFLPCGPAMESDRLKVAGEVKFGEFVWRVVELSDF